VTLEEVLGFWTGATSVPPLGFSREMEIHFVAREQLPVSHTCNMELMLWRGYTDPDRFIDDMYKAVKWGAEFQLV
jgi:hypothetical protein